MKLSNMECTAIVGLDWADAQQDLWVQAAGCEVREYDRFRHKVAAIDEQDRPCSQIYLRHQTRAPLPR